jgi:hypothetical protein
MKIGKPLFKRMAEHPQGGAPDYISSDCALAGPPHRQGFEVQRLGTAAAAASADTAAHRLRTE